MAFPDIVSVRAGIWFAIATVVAFGYAIRAIERRWTSSWGTAIVAGLVAALAARYFLLEAKASLQKAGPEMVVEAFELLKADFTPSRTPAPEGTSDGPPVVVISIDTLRWDDMKTMQSTRRLAERGQYWERAMSSSSWTLSAVASMVTGLEVHGHGAAARMGGGFQGISDEVPTIAERLAHAGYTNHAVLTNDWLIETMGFHRGFHHVLHAGEDMPNSLVFAGFPHDGSQHPGDRVTDNAIDSLDVLPDRGSFLWVHYVDTHLPWGHLDEESPMAGLTELPAVLSGEAERKPYRDAYQHEVEELDKEVSRLLDAIEARGWLDEAVIVLTADHGEAFWEHGVRGHGNDHHGMVVDVGLVLVAPGLEPGPGRGVASLVDVAPTIAVAAGLGDAETDGLDLVEGIPSGTIRHSWGNISQDVHRSARDENHRAIIDGECRLLFYDIVDDPDELHPLLGFDEHPVARSAAEMGFPTLAGEEVDVLGLVALGYVDSEGGTGSWDVCPSEDGFLAPAVAPPPTASASESPEAPEAPSDPPPAP